jgi:RNA polymerase sigma-70 factor (ECF subfamily)
VAAPLARSRFDTTRWSLVLATGGSHPSAARRALAELCEVYWYPLYAHVRRQGYSTDDARDIIQSFFLLLLERDDLQSLRPERGRFRAFLLASLRNFLSNTRVHQQALKRGGGQTLLPLEFDNAETRFLREPADSSTPETVFDRQWALAVLGQVFDRIRTEWEGRGRQAEFDRLKACLMGDLPQGGYHAVAQQLGSTEGATKAAVQRLKRRFDQELRAAIADTVTDDSVEDELRYLLKALQT